MDTHTCVFCGNQSDFEEQTGIQFESTNDIAKLTGLDKALLDDFKDQRGVVFTICNTCINRIPAKFSREKLLRAIYDPDL